MQSTSKSTTVKAQGSETPQRVVIWRDWKSEFLTAYHSKDIPNIDIDFSTLLDAQHPVRTESAIQQLINSRLGSVVRKSGIGIALTENRTHLTYFKPDLILVGQSNTPSSTSSSTSTSPTTSLRRSSKSPSKKAPTGEEGIKKNKRAKKGGRSVISVVEVKPPSKWIGHRHYRKGTSPHHS
jgi:hypothetical protein